MCVSTFTIVFQATHGVHFMGKIWLNQESLSLSMDCETEVTAGKAKV